MHPIEDDSTTIRAKYIVPPAARDVPYNLSGSLDEVSYGQHGQPIILDRLFGNRSRGFFVESGADDGEIYSNTLYFEMNRGWTGLLVEPNKE